MTRQNGANASEQTAAVMAYAPKCSSFVLPPVRTSARLGVKNYRLRLLLHCGVEWRGCCTDVALLPAVARVFWNAACADRLRWEVGYRRHSLRRLCVVFISFHSVAHIRWPRQTNRSKPRTALCCANTGSIIAFLRP
jgi:hypothetical protein